MDKNPPQQGQNKKRKESLNNLARYSGIGAQVAVPVVLGLLAGRWLDNHFLTKQPLFTAGLALLGVFIGLYIVFRDILKK
jgi:F0F1-type ATP synthase assembly protein I